MSPNIQILRMLPCLHLEDVAEAPCTRPMRLRARTVLSLPECYPHESRCTLWKSGNRCTLDAVFGVKKKFRLRADTGGGPK